MIIRLFILLFLSTTNLHAQETWSDKSRVLPDALRKIPVALYIQHGPNPNYPEKNNTGSHPEKKYVWKHETTVCSPIKELTVIKAGSFIWYDETGWKENVQCNKRDFKKKFGCKDGILKSGTSYTFKENYRWSSNLYGGDALWYVLAKDKTGKVYKGIGLLETEAELLTSNTKECELDNLQSTIEWTGYGEIGGFSQEGTIVAQKGMIKMEEENIVAANLVMDMTTISNKDQYLAKHLKDKDLFNVKKYPEASLEMISFDKGILKANLTICGISKPIECSLILQFEKEEIRIKGKLTIDRTLFGITYNSTSFFDKVGDYAIKNEFDLTFDMLFKII